MNLIEELIWVAQHGPFLSWRILAAFCLFITSASFILGLPLITYGAYLNVKSFFCK